MPAEPQGLRLSAQFQFEALPVQYGPRRRSTDLEEYRVKAELFRENAEEIRARAESISNQTTRELLHRLATEYDELAVLYDRLGTRKI